MRPFSKMNGHARMQVSKNFRLVTVDPLIWRDHYRDLDLDDTVASFISYHSEKGTYSYNWEDSFLGFCDYRQGNITKEKRGLSEGQDSLGYPLDPARRVADEQRRHAGARPGDEGYFNSHFWSTRLQHHMDSGLTHQQARQAADVDHASEFPITESNQL